MNATDGTAGDRAALRQLLGIPDMAWLLARVRGRIGAACGAPLSGIVRLQTPSDGQRLAAINLVGRPPRAGSSLRIDLADVERILRRGPWPAGLVDAVITLTGPVIDRAAARERLAAEWDRAHAALDAVGRRFPGFDVWWRGWCASGGLKRVARAEAARIGQPTGPAVAGPMVDRVVEMLAALPEGGVPLSVFARTYVGDAHGLDESRPLGRLAAMVVGAAFGGGAVPLGTVSRRDAWAMAGVVLSAVSSTVLCLGVRGAEQGESDPLGTATAAALNALHRARAPIVLTLDQVRSGGNACARPGAVVHVCENPTVVEVVARRWQRLGRDHAAAIDPVLVCTSGQPSAAVIELLERLVSAGAECRYHGDFDWAGLRIARALYSRVPWTPWRFGAEHYLDGLRRGVSSVRLTGSAVSTPWDHSLGPAMSSEGLAVEEEAVAALLAADVLARPAAAVLPCG